MAENRKGFTFIWKIENFSFSFLGKAFVSPYLTTMGGTEYKLHLYINSGFFKNLVACYISRSSNDTGPDRLELDYELSFLAGDGTVLRSKIFLKRVFPKSCWDITSYLCERRDEVFFLKKDLFIPDDTLTIRCRMWKSEESISHVERCLVETRTRTDCRNFIGTIEKFSCIEPREKYLVNIKSPSSEIFSFSINLSVATDSLLSIEIKRKDFSYVCKIFILDKYKNKVKSGHCESKFSVNELHSIPLTLSKDYLIKNKERLLPNDELTIHFEFILPGPYINEIEYIFDCEDTQARNTDVSSEEHHIESLTTLKEDWISLFRESILCDAKLKTTTETFPVHTVVLSARSPVFKSMFTNDMKEKTNYCVDIDDLDADTVRRMLLFMYSDTLDDMEYESAKSLYFAADKYDIVSLRQRCSIFLKQNLLQLNCLDILILADKHQDGDLKYAVQNYIAKNDEAVLFSDEWRNLEENNSQLTTEVFRFIYMKNRRN